MSKVRITFLILGLITAPFGLMFVDHELPRISKVVWYVGSFVLMLVFGWLGRSQAFKWSVISLLVATEVIFSRMLYYGVISNPYENTGIHYHPSVGAFFGFLFCFFINLAISAVSSGNNFEPDDLGEYLGKFWFIGLLTLVIVLWV